MFWAWRIFRKDIGRKLTAFVVAITLWFALANLLTDERSLQLQVRMVNSLAEADQQRVAAPGIYLVVPAELIVRDVAPDTVRIDVKGNKDDVRDLEISAVLEFDPDVLGDQDEAVKPVVLARDDFKSRARDPELSEFKLRPSTLDVTLARRADAEIELGPDNVVVTGRPREGYAYENSRIRIVPNSVRISGPRSAVENLVDNPDQLKLEPLDVEGRVLEVSQQVGIDIEKVDRSVTLRTTGGVVEVSVPVRPRDIAKQLFSLPVHYDNTDLLALGKRQVVEATETLDLQLTGPRSALEGLTSEQLAERIRLVFDWGTVTLDRAHEKVRIYRDGLPDSVKITDLEGRPPEISYRLESTGSDGATSTPGDSP